VDVVVTALGLPPGGGCALLPAMRQRLEWEHIPVVALADSAGQADTPTARTAGFRECHERFDREAMLESVARLTSAQPCPETEPACVGKER
jgi:CheY-like chemotaxis protein